ncbi:hypothetical protein HKX48_002223, partial [Thoreauomyces humboldtii]
MLPDDVRNDPILHKSVSERPEKKAKRWMETLILAGDLHRAEFSVASEGSNVFLRRLSVGKPRSVAEARQTQQAAYAARVSNVNAAVAADRVVLGETLPGIPAVAVVPIVDTDSLPVLPYPRDEATSDWRCLGFDRSHQCNVIRGPYDPDKNDNQTFPFLASNLGKEDLRKSQADFRKMTVKE